MKPKYQEELFSRAGQGLIFYFILDVEYALHRKQPDTHLCILLQKVEGKTDYWQWWVEEAKP